MAKPKHTCAFKSRHDPDTLEPLGQECGKPATQELHWADGRVSPACGRHGLKALDEDARALVVRVTRPKTESQWKTREHD